MPLNFPTSPAVNEQYTFAGRTWVWNGSAWDSYNPGITAYVSSLNGLTGAVTGVTAVNSGTGISITGTTNPIVTNTGVQSFNGLTGAVTGVTTSVANTFTALQTFTAGISASGSTFSGLVISTAGFSGTVNQITTTDTAAATTFYPVFVGGTGAQSPFVDIANTPNLSFVPSTSTVNAGNLSLTGLGTFAGGITASGATFTEIAAFLRGITASGATFMGNINLQNAEFIRNTTNGRIDFMPAPSAGNAYGMYMDFTGWGFGTKLGTIRSSDNATNVAGFLWDSALVTGNDVDFSFGANQAYKIRTTATNNDYKTLQLGLPAGTVGYSSALAIMDYAHSGSSNRQPNTVHTHPNVYIYSAGNASANDFIRIEHNRTNANIVTGQTSGILIQPGSGWLGISGGISASGGSTFASNVSFASTTSHTGLAAFSGGISAAGATFSGTVALNGQTFTNVVSSVNGYTGAVGGWMNAPGFTTSAQTWTDGTNNGAKTIYYLPTHYVSQADWGSYVVTANRTYFSLYNTNKPLTIKTIRALANNTTTTGNAYISVYSADPNTGLPSTRLYLSASLTVGSVYTGVSVTNSGGLVTVPAGFYYVAVTFSSTPTMFAYNRYRIPGIFGASSYSAGPFNTMPIADNNGYTAAAQFPASGVTLGYLEGSAGSYVGPVVEIAI